MVANARPRKLELRNKFIIEIDNFVSAAFTRCSELSAELEDVELKEGGSDIPVKEPGDPTFPDLTLDRGAGRDEDMWTWADECIGLSGPPKPVEEVKRNLDIVQTDRTGAEVRRWSIEGAYVKKFVAGDWDMTASEANINQLVLRIDRFNKVAVG